MPTRRIIIVGSSIWKTNHVKVAVILSRLSDKMNIFTLTTVVVFNAILVSCSTMTLQNYLEYLSRYEPRSSHQVQKKPVIGSPMVRQYFNDELVDPASQPSRPGYYDLANDPDPIIENLPPDHNNLGFLANLSESQLHELIREGLKYQEIADEMAEENEGVVQVGYNSSEESIERLEIDSLDTEDASGNLFVIVDEVHEGEHETKNVTNIESKEEDATDEEGVEVITTTQKTATKKSTTTTKDPTTSRKPANTTAIKPTTMEPTQIFAQLSSTIDTTTTPKLTTTTTPKPTTTAKSKTTTTKKALSSKKTKPTKAATTTLHPLANRISPGNALDEAQQLTPDEIDEDIVPEDPDDVDESEEIEEFSPETDLEYIDYEEQSLIDPVPNKRPSVVKPSRKPNRRPGRKPNRRPGRRPAKRPGWRPNRRPGKPIRIQINKKGFKRRGNQRPFNIKINPTKWNIQPINQSKRPAKGGGALTMCPYECRKLFLESLNI